MARENGEGGQEAPPPGHEFVPMIASLTVKLYADGNIAYEAPLSNLPVCFTMVAMMNAELAGLQFERTRREGGGIVMPSGIPAQGPRKV